MALIVRASVLLIAVLVLAPESATAVATVAADVVDGTEVVDTVVNNVVADTIGDIVVPSRAADSPADTDHCFT